MIVILLPARMVDYVKTAWTHLPAYVHKGTLEEHVKVCAVQRMDILYTNTLVHGVLVFEGLLILVCYIEGLL